MTAAAVTAKPFDRAAYGAEMFARYQALDRALVSKGFHATSDWWLEQVERYFTAGQRQMVLRVGRRGGKSSTLSRIIVVEGLYGSHAAPPGDLLVGALISVSRDESSQRLRNIKAILDAIGVTYKPIDGGIELTGKPLAFKVFTASVAGVVGFTAFCVIADEVARWIDNDTGANPATEILASLRPTLATQKLAKIVLSSSPLGRLDAHAKAFDQGNTPHQIVAFAPTWIANETISEADTHALETDEARWSREFAAVPCEETETSLLSAATLDKITRAQPGDIRPEAGVSYVLAIDPSEGVNGFAMAIAGRRFVGDRIRRSIVMVREWRSTKSVPLSPEWVMGQIAALAKPYSVDDCWTDQFSGAALRDIGARHDLYLRVEPMTAGLKIQRYTDLATMANDQAIEIPPDPMLRADLLQIRQVLTPAGFAIRLGRTSDGRHADTASVACAALAHCKVDPVAQGPIAGSKAHLAMLDSIAEESALRAFERRGQQAAEPWWVADGRAAGFSC
jgi:hypothetical protein